MFGAYFVNGLKQVMNRRLEGAFQGIKVLEITTGKSAAFCGMMLSDNGAEVIKIESSLALAVVGGAAAVGG